MEPLIIGIGHKKRVGKDAMARRLIDKWGFHRISFADTLKDAARAIFHLSEEQLYGELKEVIDPRWGRTPRELLQLIGSTLRDSIDSELWIKSTKIKIDELIRTTHGQLRIVIPDMRFPNEADAIHSWNGYACKVNRVVPINEFSNHISETALDNYTNLDAIIDNNKSLSDLYQKADQLMESILNPVERKHAFNRRPAESI